MFRRSSRKDVLERREDEADRRRRIVAIAEAKRPRIDEWLAAGGVAWRRALEPLTPAERQLVIDTLKAYEEGVSG